MSSDAEYIDESAVDSTIFDESDLTEGSDLVLRTLVDFKIFDDRGSLIQLNDLNKNGVVAHCIGVVVEPHSSEVRQYFAKYATTIGSNIVEKDPSVDGEEMDESFVEQPATVSPAADSPPPKLLTNEDRASFQVGDVLDSYCNRTYRWYEGKISDMKVEDGRTLVKIHFLGWNSKYDEWIDVFSDRLAARGSSKALVAAQKALQTDLVPWYDSERLLQKALQHCCPQSPLLKGAKRNGKPTGPAPARQKIRIEALEDWCVDFTYANPTLWLISTSGIWYRVSGSLCPGSWRGSPLPEYYPYYKNVVEQYYTTSHVVMCLLDILPINHSVAYNVIVDEASVRSQYVVNEITILKNYEFIIEQVGLLERPNDWDKKIDFKKCPFINQLRKEGILFFAQGGIQGVLNSNNKNLRKRQDLIRSLGIKTEAELEEDFQDAMADSDDEGAAAAVVASGSVAASGKKVTAKMSVLMQVEEEVKTLESLGLNHASHYNKLPILETKLRYPIEDTLLLKVERYRNMDVPHKEVTLPLPQKSRQFHPSVGADLHSTLLMTYTNLMNARHLLVLPYLTLDSFQLLLVGECKSTASNHNNKLGVLHPMWSEIHIKLLSAVLEEYTSPPSIAVANVIEEGNTATSNNGGSSNSGSSTSGAGALLVLPTVRGKSYESFLRGGGAWLEIIRILIAERQCPASVSFRDTLNPCAGIIRSLMNEPEAADFTFPVDPIACGLPRYFELVTEPMDLNTVLVRIQSGWYDDLSDAHNFTPLDHSVYHPKDFVEAGRIVDVYCELLNKWVDGHVVNVDYESKTITVRYCGWGDGNDEKLEFGTNRLLPHKTVIQDKYRRTLSPLELVEKVPQLMETLSRNSAGGSYWVPPKELLPISRQSRGQGHEGFAHDVRLVWSNCIHYYTTVAEEGADMNPIVAVAEQLSAAFERLYADNVLPSLVGDATMDVVSTSSSVKRVVDSSVTDKLKAQLKSYISSSGDVDVDCTFAADNAWLIDSQTTSYHDMSVETRLKLLGWLCGEFMNTTQFKSYLESCNDRQIKLDKASNTKGKDTDDGDGEEDIPVKSGRGAAKNAVVTPAGKGGSGNNRRVASTDNLSVAANSVESGSAYKTPQSKALLKKAPSSAALSAAPSNGVNSAGGATGVATPSKENDEEFRSVVLRHLPLGSDRYHNQYYAFHADPIRPQLYCELSDVSRQHLLAQSVTKGKGRASSSSTASAINGKVGVDSRWVIYSSIDDLASLINWLKERGIREAQLKKALCSWLESNHLELPKEKEPVAEEATTATASEDVVVGTTTGRKRKSLLPSYSDEVNNADEAVTAKRARQSAAKDAAAAAAVVAAGVSAELEAAEAADRKKALEAVDSKRRGIVKQHGKDFFEYWRNEKMDYLSVNVNNPIFRWLEVTLPESNQMGLGVKELNGGVYISSFKYSSPSTMTGSAAKTAGFRIGDQILMYNETVIKSVSNLINAMKAIVDEFTNASSSQRSSRTALTRPLIRVLLGRVDDPFEVRGFEALALREQEVMKAVLDQRVDDKARKKSISADMRVRSLSNPVTDQAPVAAGTTVLPTSPAGNRRNEGTAATAAQNGVVDNTDVVAVPWQHPKLQFFSVELPHATLDVLFNTLIQCNHPYCLPSDWIASGSSYTWISKIAELCYELRGKNNAENASKLLEAMKTCVRELESALLKCGRLLNSEWSKVAVDGNGVIVKDRSKHSVWVLYLSQCTSFPQLGYLVSLLSHSLSWRTFKSDIVQLTLSSVLPTDQFLDRQTPYRLSSSVVYYGTGHCEYLKECDVDKRCMWGSTINPSDMVGQALKCSVSGIAVYPMASTIANHETESVYTSFIQLTLTVLDTSIAGVVPAVTTSNAMSDRKNAKHVFNRLIMRILTIVKRSNASKNKLDPVDTEEYPDYNNVVSEPIDMNKMLTKCYNLHYNTTDELVDDFQLLHDNCARFNGSEYKRLVSAAASMLSDVKLLINLFSPELEACKVMSTDTNSSSNGSDSSAVAVTAAPEKAKPGRPRKNKEVVPSVPAGDATETTSESVKVTSDLKSLTICIPILKKPSGTAGNSSSSSNGCDFIVNFERYKESLSNCAYPLESLFTLKRAAAATPSEETKKDKNAAVVSNNLFVGSIVGCRPVENGTLLPWKHVKVEWHSDNYKDKQLLSCSVNPWEIEVTVGPSAKKYAGFPPFI